MDDSMMHDVTQAKDNFYSARNQKINLILY